MAISTEEWFKLPFEYRRDFWSAVNDKLNDIPNAFEEAFDLFVKSEECNEKRGLG